MVTAVRALVYSSLFIGFLLVFLPRAILARAGILPRPILDLLGIVGLLLTLLGAFLPLWCILTFVFRGKGTPAPFDPPRRLVTSGPYQFLRNPMYLGAGLALAGAGIVYRSLPLILYGFGFLLVMHLFVTLYEEPTLSRLFGAAYQTYCSHVHRWWPGL